MGEEYLFDDLVVTGGKPPYKFKAAAAFPAGLSIAEDGTISGTPKTAGPYRLRISATDANNRTGTAFVSLIVSDAPTPKITTATTLYWTRNQTVTTTLAATAGRAPYKWAKTGKSTDPLRNLPDGVTLNQNGTFSGAPSVANTFTVPIRVTDDLGKGSTKTFTIIVTSSALSITSPEVLDAAFVGISPNFNLTAQGGIAPYTWTLKNRGTLPSTISLSTAGRLSGTVNATGNFSFTAEVADSRNGTVAKAEKQLTLPVINYNLAIDTASLPAGTAGSNYAATPLVATGGKPPYAWSFTSTPTLSGLSAATGNLTGKPAVAGNYTLVLRVTDANSRTANRTLTLRVNESTALAFDPLTLPNGKVATTYNGTLGAKGGFSPYTFTLKTGSALPAGLKLVSSTGEITGKPTTAGSYKFTIILKDTKTPTANTIEREFTLVVDAYGMSIDGPATVSGKRYGSITPAQFTVTGGTANYTWSTTPALPAALDMDAKTGIVSGDLTAVVGNYTVAIKVTDGNAQSATRNATFTITAPDPVAWVTPATLPEGQVGVSYTAVDLAASGGRPAYTYAAKTGSSLPSGLALSAGKISGIPRTAGTFKFTLVASDSQSPTKVTAEREFTVVIKPAVPLAITAPNPMPAANVGSVYSPASFTASGGLPPYTWSITPSPAVPGLTFSGGNLTGTPTIAGNYTFTVRVVDSASANATRTITLPVGPVIPLEWVTPFTLPDGQVLTTYNATLTTRGGIAPVTITRISGNLSTGLTQSGTRISGTPTVAGNATFTLQAKDKNGATANRTFTLPVAPYDLSVSADSPSVVNGTVNQPLSSDPFNADGGDGDYTWSISGTKPSWLSINRDSGVLSGTSNATGNWTVNVVVTDGSRQTANKTCTVSIGLGEPPLLDSTQQLPAGMVGVPYPNPAINADGGLEPYRFTLKNGSPLPAGLSINATTGVISGTPSAAGNTTTTIVVTGANGASAERAYAIRIDAYDLAISSEVPWVLQGQVYKDFGPLPLEATGGLEPYKWSMTPASTANLTLDASGTLTGRPATAGNFSVTFRVVDARNATVTKNATIQVAPAAPVEFTTEPNLPNGKVATPYGGDVTILPVPTPVAGVTLAGKGGLAPYTYSFKTGSTPPSGLNLSTAGKITGTPSAAGTTKFFVVIKDAKNTTAEREFTLVVEPYGMAISENASVVITGNQHQPLTPTQFSVTGGRPAYVWSSTPTPPAGGLTLNATTGILSGVPTTAGNTTISVRVTDGASQTAIRNCTIRILPAANLTITSASSLPSGSMNASYSTTLTASGGKPFLTANQSTYYNWSIANRGNLPANFTLNATTGILSGTVNAVLTANFTVRVTDASNAFATKNCSLQITAPLDSGDADGDGVNNYREAYDGTDPFDPKSFNPLSVGLVAHYPFEGNTEDESGFMNRGTPVGASHVISSSFDASNCYDFNGVNSFIDIPNSIGNSESGTISVWFNAKTWNQNSKGRYLFSITQSPALSITTESAPAGSGDWINLGIHPNSSGNNNLLFGVWADSGWQWADSADSARTNEWQNVVGIFDKDRISIYINGIKKGEIPNDGYPVTAARKFVIGASAWAGTAFNGKIDEVRIYNRALIAAEVSQIYSEESGEPNMVLVQGGTLPAGSALANQTVSAFHIARFETTWAEWKQVRTWATANGYDIGTVGQGSSDNHPVRNVTWYDAVKWLNAKSQMEGLMPVYSVNGTTYKTGQFIPTLLATANGYRLPAEAEWEWAARGGVLSQGYTYSGSNDPNQVAWYLQNSGNSTVSLDAGRGTWPVGKKLPNELGIFDMSGNLWEWCSAFNSQRMPIRGGSWAANNADFCPVAVRHDLILPNYADNSYGFRYARNAKGSATLQIDDVTKTYNGAPQGVTVRTTPENLKVNVNYNGTAQDGTAYQSSTPPTKVGTYTVNAEIDDANYQGANSATLVISKAQAQLNISGTQQTYTGYYIPISISSNQSISGLSVNYSKVDPYSGSQTPLPTVIYSLGYQQPDNNGLYFYNSIWGENFSSSNATNAGTYNVSITSNDPNYECIYNVQLVVAKANIDWLQLSSTTSSTSNGQPVSGVCTGVFNMQYVPVKFTETRPNSFPQMPVLTVTYTKWQNYNQIIGPVNYTWYGGYMGGPIGALGYLPDQFYSETQAGIYDVTISTNDPNFDCNITGRLEVDKADRSSDYQMSATETRFSGNGISPIIISRSANYSSTLGIDPTKIKVTYYRNNYGGGNMWNPQYSYAGEVVYNSATQGWPYPQVTYVSSGSIYTLLPGDYMVNAEVDDVDQKGAFSTQLTITKAQLDYQITKTQQIYTGNYAPIGLKILNYNQLLGQRPSSLRVDYYPKSVFENGQYVTRGESQSVNYTIKSEQNQNYTFDYTYEPEQMSNFPTMVGEYNIRISYPYNPYNPGGNQGSDPNALFEEYSSPTSLVVAEPMVTVQGGTLPQNSALAGQKVQAFQIGKLEVTWGEWKTIRDWATANGYPDLANVGEGSADNHPVRNVSWYDVVKWCNAKSEKEGLSPVYSMNGTTYKTGQTTPTPNPTANGYRLPYELEWEWAARGGVSSQGYTYSGSNDVNAVAWYRGNSNGAFVDLGINWGGSGYSGRGTWPVGLKLSNELGVFDMCGNVLEWCSDDLSGQRVIRGSDWATDATDCVIGVSRSSQPTWVGRNAGFRLARNIGPKIAMNSTLPDALRNQPYGGYTFGVNEGSGVKVWSISEGTLPPGMSFSANGTLSGTPTTAGTYTFVIRLDSGGYWDEVEVVFKVTPTPNPLTPLNGTESFIVMSAASLVDANSTGDYVSLGSATPYSLAFRIWNSTLGTFESKPLETFINSRISSGANSRVKIYTNNIVNDRATQLLTAEFKQGSGQSGSTIAAYLICPASLGTISRVKVGDHIYTTFPAGGKTSGVTGTGDLTINSVPYTLYKFFGNLVIGTTIDFKILTSADP
jgi:formylglycine-generating enzyme required for sulfatase activity